MKWYYSGRPLLIFSLSFSKISICLFLLRVLDKTHIKFRRAFLYFLIFLALVNAVISAACVLDRCRPVRKSWNPKVPGHCKDPKIFWRFAYVNGALNAFGDFALALFPISFIKDLNLPLRRKVMVFCLMSCGVICGALSITRTVAGSDLAPRSDTTWDSVDASILSVVEENVSIIVACVPTLGSLISYWHKKTKSKNSRQSSYELRARGQRRRSQMWRESISKPSRTAVPYGPSSLARQDTGPDDASGATFESVPSLAPIIQKTMQIDVERSNVAAV